MLLATLFLIYWDWDSLKILINKKPTNSTKKSLENDNLWVYIGLSFIIITTIARLFIFNQYIVITFLLMALIALAGFIIGYRKRKLY